MQRLLAAATLLALLATPLYADDAGKLLKERLDAQKAGQDLDAEMHKATAALATEASGLSTQVYQIGRAALTDDQIADTRKRIESEQTQIASMQADIASLQKQIELAALKDPAERAAKLKDLQDQQRAANDKLREAAAPFTKRKDDLFGPLAKTDPDFVAVLEKCMKSGTDKYAAAVHDKPLWFGSTSNGQYHWREAGKDVVWSSLFLQPKPYAAPAAGAKSIDGKYAYNYNGNTIWVQAGYFNVSLIINKPEWADEASATALVKNILDLDALAALKPE